MSNKMFTKETMDSLELLGDILSVLSSRLPASNYNNNNNTNNNEDELPKYNYPSAGHLYPVQTLIFIPSNNYLGYHHPLNNCLVKLPNPHNLFDIINNYKHQHELTSSTSSSSSSISETQTLSSSFYIFFIAERQAIEPVYGEELSLDFCYLEAGYMEELIHLNLDDILSHNHTSAFLSSIPINSEDEELHKELNLSSSQIPLHMLVLQQ